MLDTTIQKQTQITVNKTCTLPQTTGGKDEQNIVSMRSHNTDLRTQRHTTGQHKNTEKMSNTDPTKNPGVNSGAREG